MMGKKSGSFLIAQLIILLSATGMPLLAQLPNSSRERTAIPFSVGEVIQTVNTPQSREGEFLIDTSAAYGQTSGEQNNQDITFDGTNYLVVWHDSRNGPRDIYGTRVNQTGTVLDPNGILISTAASEDEYPAVAFNGQYYLVVWRDRSGYDIRGARVDQSGNLVDTSGIAIAIASDYQSMPDVASNGVDFFVVWQDSRNGEYDIYGARVHNSGVVVDTMGIEISTADSYQLAPAISFCNGMFLVVWYDNRNNSHDIYGARVTPSGTVLDPTGIAISTAYADQQHPSSVSDGNYHFVVWHDYRGGTPDVFGARVDSDGVVVDPAGIGISLATEEQMYPHIAYNGTHYLVAWLDGRYGLQSYVVGARVTQSGTVLDPTGIVISNHGFIPSVASDSTNSLVCWSHDSDVYGARVDEAGTVLEPSGILLSVGTNSQWEPAVAFDGENYLVVWADSRNEGDICGIRVDPSGNALDPCAIEISTAPDIQRYVSVAFGGNYYLVVWEDERNYPETRIYGARVTRSGTVLDPSGIFITSPDTDENRPHPSVASDGNLFLIVWEHIQWFPYLDIIGRFLDQSANFVGYPFVVSSAQDYQFHPVVTFGDNYYLVAWQDCRSGVNDIYGTRVASGGTILDPLGIAISTAADHQLNPALAFDGSNYLAVWTDRRNGGLYHEDIYGARVAPSGAVLDPQGIPISLAPNGQGGPSAAYNGFDYLVVWADLRNGSEYDIYGALIDSSGTVIDSFPVSLQPQDQVSAEVAHGSGQQVLGIYSGWTEAYGGTSYNAIRIWGKFYPFTDIAEDEAKVSRPLQLTATIFSGPLQLPPGKRCRVFDITGRFVEPLNIAPGIYFIEIEGSVTQKAVKIR